VPDHAEHLANLLPFARRGLSVLDVRHTAAGQRYELTNSRFIALDTVVRAGHMTMSELASALDCKPSVATRTVDELVGHSLLARLTDTADRRRVLVAATGQGQRVHRKVHREMTELIGSSLERMTPRETHALLIGLQGFVSASRSTSGQARPTHRHG
jgi:DNA-binding MarR family transcriptional regulator